MNNLIEEYTLGAPYKTFAEVLRDLSSHHRGWSQTSKVDRTLQVIWSQVLLSSTASKAARMTAFEQYFALRRSMGQEWFPDADGPTRNGIRRETLHGRLVANSEPYLSRCGDFHRALTKVWDEHKGFETAYLNWFNFAVQGMRAGLGLATAPYVNSTNHYRIGAGPVLNNSGGTISVADGTPLTMFVSGVNFASVQWQRNSSNVADATSESLTITVQSSTAGTYNCIFTNPTGSTTSAPNFVVAVS